MIAPMTKEQRMTGMTFPLGRMAAFVALCTALPAGAMQARGPVPVDLPPSQPAAPVTPDAIVTPGTDPESAAINAAEAQKAQARSQTYQAQRDARARAATEQRQAYEAAQAAYETDTARINRDNAALKAQWEADTAACIAGDKTRCAPGPAPQ